MSRPKQALARPIPGLRILLIAGAIGVVAYFVSFRYWVPTRVCTSDPDALTQYIGEYPDEVFLTTLAGTRSVPNAIKAASLVGGYRPIAVSITSDGIATTDSWREVVAVDCAYLLTNQLHLEGRTEPYVRMKVPNDGAPTKAAYFDVLFSNCYRDAQGEPWCFRPNQVQIGQTSYQGELMLDLKELPNENVVRLNHGDDLLVFRAISAGRWAVNQSQWAPSRTALDWEHPWRVLTPAPATNSTNTR